MIAKAILFKTTQKIVRPLVPAFQANVVVYTLGVLVNRLGKRIDLDRIWADQVVPAAIQEQIRIWAGEVYRALQNSANGKMISEWAKRPECWEEVRATTFSDPIMVT